MRSVKDDVVISNAHKNMEAFNNIPTTQNVMLALPEIKFKEKTKQKYDRLDVLSGFKSLVDSFSVRDNTTEGIVYIKIFAQEKSYYTNIRMFPLFKALLYYQYSESPYANKIGTILVSKCVDHFLTRNIELPIKMETTNNIEVLLLREFNIFLVDYFNKYGIPYTVNGTLYNEVGLIDIVEFSEEEQDLLSFNIDINNITSEAPDKKEVIVDMDALLKASRL